MSNPQHHAHESDTFPLSIELEPKSKPQLSYSRDDDDPVALIALLRQWRDEPEEDPGADRAEFLAFDQAIDEDRGGDWLFEEYYTE